MKRYIKQFAFLLPLFFLAAVVSSYAPPTAVPPGANADGPITVGDEIGLKTGGLSVTTFQGRGNSSLIQDSYFNGQINGGHPSDTSSTITFGETSAPFTTTVSGTIKANNGKSSALASSTPELKHVCGAADGTYVLCATTPPPTPTDLCPNIPGDQATVPSGLQIDGSGDCVTPPPTPPSNCPPGQVEILYFAGLPPNCVEPGNEASMADTSITAQQWGGANNNQPIYATNVTAILSAPVSVNTPITFKVQRLLAGGGTSYKQLTITVLAGQLYAWGGDIDTYGLFGGSETFSPSDPNRPVAIVKLDGSLFYFNASSATTRNGACVVPPLPAGVNMAASHLVACQ